jgi:hypothetical protein
MAPSCTTRKPLFVTGYLFILALPLFALPSWAGNPTANFTINVVASGGGPPPAFITSATIQETSGANQSANWPFSRGQAFKAGDIPTGTHPEIRTASGGACTGTLLAYQWDEIATRTQNGRDGSWMHAVYTVNLPAVGANQYVTVEFCRVAGAYSATPASTTLSTLCAGTHQFNIILTNMANQDDSTRGTGQAKFDLCSNIANTGRDAPETVASGPVRNSYVVHGMFRYGSAGTYTGSYDPLLYVRWYIDLYPDPTAPTSIYKIRQIANIANSWISVAAGTTGEASGAICNGTACPSGLTGDPQMISYLPTVYDSATAIIDYDGTFSQTIADAAAVQRTVSLASNSSPGIGSSSFSVPGLGSTAAGVWFGTFVTNTTNPNSIPANCYVLSPLNGTLSCTTAAGTRGNGVQSGDILRFDNYFAQTNNPSGSPSGGNNTDAMFTIPKSAGNHIWYVGSAFRYTTSGTAPTGMSGAIGKLLMAMPVSVQYQGIAGDRVQLSTTPDYTRSSAVAPPYLMAPTARGSGAQTLSYRVPHRKFETWYTADPDGQPLWTGSPSSEPFEVAFDHGGTDGTPVERNYWMSSGVIPAFHLEDAAYWEGYVPFSNVQQSYAHSTGYYWPGGVTMNTGGSSGGQRGDIGIVTEWGARWWFLPQPSRYRWVRMFALDGESFPATSILNEATGYPPTVNNGAPLPGLGGGGTPYSGLGNLYPHMSNLLIHNDFTNVVEPASGTNGGLLDDTNAWWYGPWPTGIYPDHQAAYSSAFNYPIQGTHYGLEAQLMQMQRSITVHDDFGANYAAETRPQSRTFTIPSSSGTPTYAGVTFYGSHPIGDDYQQGPRSSGWQMRALGLAAAMGADTNPASRAPNLKSYVYDNTVEMDNFWTALAAMKDCTTPGTPQPGAWSRTASAIANYPETQQFMSLYIAAGTVEEALLVGSPSAIDRINNAMYAGVRQAFGAAGWPTSTPAIYGGSFFALTWADIAHSQWGRCRAPYAGGDSDYAFAEPWAALNATNGKIMVWQQTPGDATMTFTAGDKVKSFLVGNTTSAWGGSTLNANGDAAGPALTAPAPLQIPTTSFVCIVNINNTDHTYQVAPPNPSCATPGTTVTGFTGTWDTTYDCYAPPYFENTYPSFVSKIGAPGDQIYMCTEGLAYRLQNTTYPANPNYVWWGEKYTELLVSAGVSAAAANYTAALTSGISLGDVNGSNAAFDFDHNRIVPP